MSEFMLSLGVMLMMMVVVTVEAVCTCAPKGCTCAPGVCTSAECRMQGIKMCLLHDSVSKCSEVKSRGYLFPALYLRVKGHCEPCICVRELQMAA